MIGSLPLVIVLPEVGLPVILLALRLLAAESEWAARAYAWLAWRWGQLRGWLRTRSPATRVALSLALLALVVLIVCLAFD